jgi:hypothetical protein
MQWEEISWKNFYMVLKLSTRKTSPRYLLTLEVHTRLPRDHWARLFQTSVAFSGLSLLVTEQEKSCALPWWSHVTPDPGWIIVQLWRPFPTLHFADFSRARIFSHLHEKIRQKSHCAPCPLLEEIIFLKLFIPYTPSYIRIPKYCNFHDNLYFWNLFSTCSQ